MWVPTLRNSILGSTLGFPLFRETAISLSGAGLQPEATAARLANPLFLNIWVAFKITGLYWVFFSEIMAKKMETTIVYLGYGWLSK